MNMETRDYRQYYYLETYVFETVGPRFHQQGYLSAFDFFCIIIWKANRSKTKIARRLLNQSNAPTLEEAVSRLTRGLFQQPDHKAMLHYLWQWETWGFRLPMSSAILTVLYPEAFTIYDKRICDTLGDFHSLNYRTDFEEVWDGYQTFKQRVEQAAPGDMILRDKDRYLWAKSFYEEVQHDIELGFHREQED